MSKCWLYDRCSHVDCDSDFCIRKYKLDRLYENAGLSEKQKQHIILRIDADGTDLEAFKTLKNFEDNIEEFVEKGYNLYLHSATSGNGKTSVAVRFLESYLDRIWAKSDLDCHALFIHVGSFLDALKAHLYQESDNRIAYILDNITKADIVVWDEIGEKVGSEFEVSRLLSLISARINAGKSNIYTTNKSPLEIRQLLGDRLASRICHESIDIELKGSDKRHQDIPVLGGNK